MKKFILSLLAIAAVTAVVAQTWQNDILDDNYEMRYVDQGSDYSGPVRSTIVRKQSKCGNDKAVLYIHGYNDYFFQKEMGDRFVDSCYNFYAVDLRKYGRSILPDQKKFEARDLHEYFADIDSALSQIRRDGNNEIVLIGHSTGGLISSLYMNEHKDSIDNDIKGLILNSPFLEWNFKPFMRKFVIPAFGSLHNIFPKLSVSQDSNSFYQQSLLTKYHGEWDYNQDWKVFKPEKIESSWVHAISDAQKKLKNNADIKVPILLMHSSGSVSGDSWSPDFLNNDAVLNVDDISRIGRQLGDNVDEVTIKNGLHDLILSSPESREQAYQSIFTWLDKHF